MATSHFMSCPSPEDTCPSKLFSYRCLGYDLLIMVLVWSDSYFHISRLHVVTTHYKFMTLFKQHAKKLLKIIINLM